MAKSNVPTYRRLPEDERRQLLVQATLDCLASYNLAGTTVRRIAEKAEVTPGLVTHYFSGKEALIGAAYQYLAEKYLHDYRRLSDSTAVNPIEQLKAFIGAAFEPETLDQDLLRVWTGFWTLSLSDKSIQAIHQDTAKKTRQHLGKLIRNSFEFMGKEIDDKEVFELTIVIWSLVDGMWLTWGLDPNLFKAQTGRRIALDMIAARLGLPDLQDENSERLTGP